MKIVRFTGLVRRRPGRARRRYRRLCSSPGPCPPIESRISSSTRPDQVGRQHAAGHSEVAIMIVGSTHLALNEP